MLHGEAAHWEAKFSFILPPTTTTSEAATVETTTTSSQSIGNRRNPRSRYLHRRNLDLTSNVKKSEGIKSVERVTESGVRCITTCKLAELSVICVQTLRITVYFITV